MSRSESLKIRAKLLQKSKLRAGQSIALKEAYEIIAKSAGYESWRAMKSAVERFEVFRPRNGGLPYWNNWYSSYDEAKGYLEGSENYLLPYENQVFMCGLDYIEALGVSADDPDLGLVGRDWVTPKDPEALARIVAKLKRTSQKSIV